MPAKFEDLPLEAHSLISRHLNRSDCFEMRQACSLWRYVLNYEVALWENVISEILDDVKNGKSSLDFTYINPTAFDDEYEEGDCFIKELEELLRIIGDQVVHLACEHVDILDSQKILPNLKTEIIVPPIIWLAQINVPFSYKITNIRNCDEFSSWIFTESCGRYVTEVKFCGDTITNEPLQRAITTWNNLEILHFEDISISSEDQEFMKMCAIHLPASAPLKVLEICSPDDFADIFEIFRKKWAHSLEIINLNLWCPYYNTSISSLKDLRALHALKLSGSIHLPHFELYNAIASTINTNLKKLELADIEIDEEEIISVLENLPNLHNLTLDSCGRSVTDRTLTTIFRRLTRLRYLHVTCYGCTDAGFLGFGDTPYPISRLRGLTYLKIDSNENLTEGIIKEIARLKELRDIELKDDNLYPKLLKMLSDDCCTDLREKIEERAIYVITKFCYSFYSSADNAFN